MRMEAGRGGTDLSRRRRARHRAGDGARPSRRLPRRGRRQGGRRVQGDGRPLRAVRPVAGARHADLRAGDPRRGDGRGDDGLAADRGDHVLRLPRGLLRLRRQRDVEAALHDERATLLPARDPDRQRRRSALRRAALAVDRELDDDDPRREGRCAFIAGRCDRPDGGRRARSRSRHLSRAQVALRDRRARCPTARSSTRLERRRSFAPAATARSSRSP